MTTDDRMRDDRLHELLAEGATAARAARPWGDFVGVARRSLRVHRIMVAGVAACVSILAVVGAGQLIGFGANNQGDVVDPAGPLTSMGSGETPPPPPASHEPCDFPLARPTYLPWLQKGEEVGPPIRDKAEPGDEGSDFASLLWPWEEGDPDSDYSNVSLFTQTGEGYEVYGKVVDVEINGSKGRFEIAPGDGDAAITWLTGSGRCNVTVLTLRTSGWDDSRLEEEITRVARSLVEGDE